MTKKFNIEDYDHYFSNILQEKWQFDEVKTSQQFQFEKNKVEEILYENSHEHTSYLIGKCPQFYFIAVLEQEEDYSYTFMYKQDSVAPLVKNIKHMKELHPNIKNKHFIKSVLFEKKLNELLPEKEIVYKMMKI